MSSRSFWLSVVLGLCALPAAVAEDERPEPPVEVHEWSVWVGSPAQRSLNAARIYRNAMPGTVGTSRPKLEEKELARKFPIAPLSVVQFFGKASKDLDVDLRVKKGTLVAHWPPGSERSGRVQWLKADLVQAPPAGTLLGYLPENHWLQKLRRVDSALYLKRESRAERFLAYDAEVAMPVPLKIRGGPDEYTLQNLTNYRLLDVAVVVPTEAGFRVGWLDELPTADPELEKKKADEARKKEKGPVAKKSDREQAEDVFKEAEAAEKKAKESRKKGEEIKPLPEEGDANVRAGVDQILNRPITVNVEKAPRREVLDLVATQARVRYELDEPTLAKDKVDLGGSMTLKAAGIAARDALAEVLGSAGLSYRITSDGTLFITTAARLAEDADKKGTVIEGPPIKLTLSQPKPAANPSYRELTRDSYARRLARQGLRDEMVQSLLDRYGEALFEPEGLIVLAHLSRDALDEAVVLNAFPAPQKVVRTALVVVHGVDPRLQDNARKLVKRLGDPSPKVRDDAESKLFEMGPVAIPVLEDALRDKDIETVFRAERLLMRLNRPVP